MFYKQYTTNWRKLTSRMQFVRQYFPLIQILFSVAVQIVWNYGQVDHMLQTQM